MILIEKHGKILICLLEIKEYCTIKTTCSKGRMKMEEIEKFLKEKGYEDSDINKKKL